MNSSPLAFAGVFSSSTAISSTTCSPAGMSMPTAGSSMTRLVAVPVLTGVQGCEPEMRATLTKRRSAADAARSSRIFTS